ncbi:MAG: ATP-binding protein [Cyclobacteriaceae bacterium]
MPGNQDEIENLGVIHFLKEENYDRTGKLLNLLTTTGLDRFEATRQLTLISTFLKELSARLSGNFDLQFYVHDKSLFLKVQIPSGEQKNIISQASQAQFFREDTDDSVPDKMILCKEIRMKKPLSDTETKDVTHIINLLPEKEMRALMFKKNIELEAVNKDLKHFVYIASHDLQEPLRTMTNYLNILEEDYSESFDDEGKRLINVINRANTRMIDLIKGLLDYSRLGRGKEKLAEIDCNEMIAEILLDLESLINEKNVQIKYAKLPTIKGLKVEMRLLFHNLMTNGIKFCKEGKIPKIEIASTEDSDFWQFKVSDNGIGIEKKHQKNIFAIFNRLHSASEYQGTGIGLAHCQKIVELHHGRIWVESQPGHGSKFHFTIKKSIE